VTTPTLTVPLVATAGAAVGEPVVATGDRAAGEAPVPPVAGDAPAGLAGLAAVAAVVGAVVAPPPAAPVGVAARPIVGG
jgi:hypothetical protein